VSLSERRNETLNFRSGNGIEVSNLRRGDAGLFAVGHLALGYLMGAGVGRLFKRKPNVALLLFLAVFPDVDLLIPGLKHRGPTHSLIFSLLLFTPLFVAYGIKAAPYFVALIQHALIGDFITEGAQLFWPMTRQVYGLSVEMDSLPNFLLEWGFFLIFLASALQTRDLYRLFQLHRSNLLLVIPLCTVLLPVVLYFPTYVPLELLIPHLIYIALFALSIAADLKAIIASHLH
jgi:membrane-bound metal-dependent hydrolase YbcI (DUF457 family)